MIQVRVFKSVAEIGKDRIDSLSNDGLFTHGWFKIVENTSFYKVDPFYVTVFNGGKLVAFAPCFLGFADYGFGDYRSHWTPKLGFLPEKLLHWGSRLNLPLARVLQCYSPDCYRSEVLVEKSYDGRSALNQICKGIDFVCDKNRILFSSFPFVSEHDNLLMSGLEDLGYQKSPWESCLDLDIHWASFDEYLKSLRVQTRHNIRGEIRRFGESGIKIEVVSEFGELSETLSNLYANLVWKRNKKKGIYDAAFYRRLNEFAGDKIKLFVAKKNDQVVGFSCCFRQGETLDAHHCGFNYEVLGRHDFTYFNLGYVAPVKWSIENGVKRIFYARALPEVKKRRGCKPERVFSFTKCQNRALRNCDAFKQRYPDAPFPSLMRENR